MRKPATAAACSPRSSRCTAPVQKKPTTTSVPVHRNSPTMSIGSHWESRDRKGCDGALRKHQKCWRQIAPCARIVRHAKGMLQQ